MSNREYVKTLIQVMNDNPTLDVLCRVNSEVVGADDGYDWWLGKLNTKISIKVDEYSDCIGETIKFKSDDDYDEWIEDLYDIDDFVDVPDSEWDDFCKKKVDEVANWKRAILVCVTTL